MLIEPKDLADLISQGAVTVFDCRFSLAQPKQGFEDYLSGHIPEAHYLNLEYDLSGPVREHGGRHPLPNLHEFLAKVAKAGLSSEKTVVVYDAGGGMAQRAWWLFEYVGHPDVQVLNGGFGAWQEAGLPISVEVPTASTGSFTPKIHTDAIVSVDDVEQMVAGERPDLLVDARAAARFLGEVEPIDKVAGHIPGAWNRSWEDGVDASGRWKGREAQRERFAKLLETSRPLVMYCGSGVTACANLFALRIAGVSNAKLYPGSWSDWSSYPDHGVETTNPEGSN
ncbi:sulfurtransferase [Alicyclobacillus ferrooxydans]|uniref:Rhodanese domain-containing protein n=1 Tax=Alicyclobacillus ferrooxydans TaxID=471514 RepID=A0A0N8PP52_9BACL|nr:sulfurtransferase [Alicyclobacillus ferrooxydans]KPV43357.1 hypothetical protein AN477_13000 [Alicyclobacillus ferrooxydans]